MHRRHAGFLTLVAILAHLLGAVAVRAQTGPARVVKDINTARTSGSGSSPTGFIEFRGEAYFTAYTLDTGQELWRSDGTEAGTVLVKDIRPGPLGSGAQRFTVIGDTLFLVADDGAHGWELWKSDGTEAGTLLVEDIQPGPAGSVPFSVFSPPVEAGGLLLFVADDGVHGPELWRSDGTDAGTDLVRDIRPGPGGGSASFALTGLGGCVLFQADDGLSGAELWRSDGTEAGTYALTDLRPGWESSYPRIIGRGAGLVFFTASYGAYSSESVFLKSDGTVEGTSFVKELTRLYGSTGVEYAGELYFTARNWSSQPELWRSDGSAEGTVLVRTFPVLPNQGDVGGCYGFKEFQGDLYFLFQDGDPDRFQLWKTQDAGASVTHVKDLNPGGGGTRIYFVDLTVGNDGLIFHSYDAEHGYELWKSDGTAEGTTFFQDIRPGPSSSSPFNLASINGVVFFSANDGVHMTEPWKTDGVEGATALVKDINSVIFTASSSPENAVALGRNLLFTAQAGTGRELWKSDGTEAGTVLLKDINPGFLSSGPGALTVVGDVAFFVADDGVHGREVWKTDGTEAGTVLVKDIKPGLDSSEPGALNLAYGVLFFDADDGIHGHELWRSDGTETGTFLVKDINPGPDPSYPLESPGDNPVLFFDADDGIHGFELWTSDGTEEGTFLVKDIVPGPGSSYSGRAYAVQGAFVFVADDGIHGREPWRTDGSEDGTFLLKDILPGGFGSFSGQCTRVADMLFLVAYDGVAGEELWKSDGTEAGTVLVKDIQPGGEGAYVQHLTAVGETLFFTANVYTDQIFTGDELWKSNGTEAGTVMVKDLTPEDSSNPDNLLAVNGILFFSAWDDQQERELWRSDGTEAGTVRVQDLAPGPFSSSPRNLTLAGSRLFFSADDVVLGRELWAGRASILAGRPRQAIEDLTGELEDAGLPDGIERSLTSKLRAAAAALGRRGGNPAAIRLLQAVVRELEGLDASPSLLEFAQDIVDLLDGEVSVSPLPPRATLLKRAYEGK